MIISHKVKCPYCNMFTNVDMFEGDTNSICYYCEEEFVVDIKISTRKLKDGE